MSKHIRNFCLISLLVLSGYGALLAQKTDVSFKVVNRVDSLALEKTSVILIRDRDSAFLGFGLTDSTGQYTFSHLKLKGGTSFVVSALGFIAQKLPVEPTDSGLIRRFVTLVPDTNLLSEVIVEASSAVRMNGDTLEYNTDFFKTMPNAVVEELLKKLPGIEFRNNNEIYADGQRVSKITVDGKEFFSSDPEVLLKNLPADLIKKVQIVDEKNTVATETREKQDIPKIINLKLKKAVRQGILGKIFAGYGTDKRYETGGLLNLFRDTLQVSLIGTSNNQSSQGFSMQDLSEIGGFDRSADMGGQQGYSLNGFGHAGIPKKSLAGTNLNYNFTRDIQLNLQYFYKNNSTRSDFTNIMDEAVGDTTRHVSSTGQGKTGENSHQIHTGFTWKQDSTGYLRYNFDWTYNRSNNFNNGESRTRTTHITLLNTAASDNRSQNSQHNINTNASYSKTFTRPKIDINLDGSYSQGLSASDNYINNITTQYIQGYIPDSILRHELSHLPTTHSSITASLNKTIHENNMLLASASYDNDLGHSGNEVYQRFSLLDDYAYTPGQSVKYSNQTGHFTAGLAYRFQGPKSRLHIKLGGKFDSYAITNIYTDAAIGTQKRQYNLYSPDLSINYKSLGLNFSRSMQPPSAYLISPITDSTSNLYYRTGNPDLAASTSSNLSLSYNKYWFKQQFSLYTNLSQRWNQNNAISKTDIDANGVSRTTYINYGQGSNTTLNIGLNKSYHKKDFNMGTSLNIYGMQSKTPLYLNSAITQTTNQNYYININANSTYKETIQMDAGWNMNFSSSSSKDQTFRTNKTHTIATYLNLKWKPTHRLVFQWNNRLNTQSSPTPGQKNRWYFSDASIAYSCFKKENVAFRLSGYDLFNQNKGSFQYAYQNMVYSRQDLVQKRYFMLTVSYKFRKISH